MSSSVGPTTRVITPIQAELARKAMLPTGALAETMPRSATTVATGPLATGVMRLAAIHLLNGWTINSISFISGTTAAVTPTNWWFALYDANRALLKQTADQLTAAWAANTLKTLNLTSSQRITASGLYYVGVMVAAATPPTLQSGVCQAALAGLAPIIYGTSTSALTTTAPNPAAALTAVPGPAYAYVS